MLSFQPLDEHSLINGCRGVVQQGGPDPWYILGGHAKAVVKYEKYGTLSINDVAQLMGNS